MLGKLATYLRMCGYDTVYALDRGVEADDRLLGIAREEGRVLLTRDVDLARRADDGVLLESREIVDQLREVEHAEIELTLADPPRRCSRCNGSLGRVESGESRPEYVADGVAAWRCRDCGQFFWKGSHWDDVANRLANL